MSWPSVSSALPSALPAEVPASGLPKLPPDFALRACRKELLRPCSSVARLVPCLISPSARESRVASKMYRNMPVDLVLVRHGQSEGNLAQRLCRQQQQNADTLAGSNDPLSASTSSVRDKASADLGMGVWSKEFRERHNSLYRLTDKGRMQAAVAGRWIRSHVATLFDKYFTSEYVRAMETAAMLSLPSARWATEMYLRERDRGILANKPHHERHEQHPEEMRRKERDAFYWQPSGGESIANLCLRVDRVMENLCESCSGLRVIIVCHGGVIKSFRALIERVRPTESRSSVSSGSGPGGGTGAATAARGQLEKIHNCQIVWYSRRDPRTGSISSKYNWVKSVCPWNMNLSSNQWREIRRHVYSNEELLRSVHQVPQLVNRSLDELDAPFQSLALISSPGLPTSRHDGAQSLLAVAAAAAVVAASAPLGASPRHPATVYGPVPPPGQAQQASSPSPPRLQNETLPAPSGKEEEPGPENAVVIEEDFDELLSDDSECSDSDIDALLAQPPSLVLHGESTPPSPRDEEAVASLPRASEEEADEELEDEEGEETHREEPDICSVEAKNAADMSGEEGRQSEESRQSEEGRQSAKANGPCALRSGPSPTSLTEDSSTWTRRTSLRAEPAAGTGHKVPTGRTGPPPPEESGHDGRARLDSTVSREKRGATGTSEEPGSANLATHRGGKNGDRHGELCPASEEATCTPRSPLSTRRLAASSLRRHRNPLQASSCLLTSDELLHCVAASRSSPGGPSSRPTSSSLLDGALHPDPSGSSSVPVYLPVWGEDRETDGKHSASESSEAIHQSIDGRPMSRSLSVEASGPIGRRHSANDVRKRREGPLASRPRARGWSEANLTTIACAYLGCVSASSPKVATCAAQKDKAGAPTRPAIHGVQTWKETEDRPDSSLALDCCVQAPKQQPASPTLQTGAEGSGGATADLKNAFVERASLCTPERRRGLPRQENSSSCAAPATSRSPRRLASYEGRNIGLSPHADSGHGFEEGEGCPLDDRHDKTPGGKGAQGCGCCSDRIVASSLTSAESFRLGAVSTRDIQAPVGLRRTNLAQNEDSGEEDTSSLTAAENADKSSTCSTQRQGAQANMPSLAADSSVSRTAPSVLPVISPIPCSPDAQSDPQLQGPPESRNTPTSTRENGVSNEDTSVSSLTGDVCVPSPYEACESDASAFECMTLTPGDRERRGPQEGERFGDLGESECAEVQLASSAESTLPGKSVGSTGPALSGAGAPSPSRFVQCGPGGAEGGAFWPSSPWHASDGLRQLLLLQQNSLRLLYRQQETFRATSGLPMAGATNGAQGAFGSQTGGDSSSVETRGQPVPGGPASEPSASCCGGLREFACVQHQILQQLQHQQLIQLQLQQILLEALLPGVQPVLMPGGPVDRAGPLMSLPSPPFGFPAGSTEYGSLGDMSAPTALSLRDPLCGLQTSGPCGRGGFGVHRSDYLRDRRADSFMRRSTDAADIVNIPPLPVPCPPYGGNNSDMASQAAGSAALGRGPHLSGGGTQAPYTHQSSQNSGAVPKTAYDSQTGAVDSGSPRSVCASMGSGITLEQNFLDSIGFSRDIHRIVSHERDRVVDEYQRFLAAQTQRQQATAGRSSFEDAIAFPTPLLSSSGWPPVIPCYLMSSDEHLLPLPASHSHAEGASPPAGRSESAEQRDLRFQNAQGAQKGDTSCSARAATETGEGTRLPETDTRWPGECAVASQTPPATVSEASTGASACREYQQRNVRFSTQPPSETATASWSRDGGQAGPQNGQRASSRASGADEGAGRRDWQRPATSEARGSVLDGADSKEFGQKREAGKDAESQSADDQGKGAKVSVFKIVDERKEQNPARQTDGGITQEGKEPLDEKKKETAVAMPSARRDTDPLLSPRAPCASSVSLDSSVRSDPFPDVSAASASKPSSLSKEFLPLAGPACPATVVGSDSTAASVSGSSSSSPDACICSTDPQARQCRGNSGTLVEEQKTKERATRRENAESGSEGELARDRGRGRRRDEEEEDADDEWPHDHADELRDESDSVDSDHECRSMWTTR
uniref:phosphoglycerate mutase (2,3-diphosphoglycerate-dependent) n=1 Tax=Toxoplasma gondii COUG TaxID=1074873 RepID=A0A2G8XR94_TOXGO|nr:phosphoglycerate mutase family protein [Toxoplasma gondii COUG]